MWRILVLAAAAGLAMGVAGQQLYQDNSQLDCENNSTEVDFGYACNGLQRHCQAYALYRTQDGYRSLSQIGSLLNSDASQISVINNVSVTQTLGFDRQMIAPVNCSCAGAYSQANASYPVRNGDTYLIIANNTFEGLTTCQALIRQNPYEINALPVGKSIRVPLRCACPTLGQTRRGVKYLLSYVVATGDDVPTIGSRFNASAQEVWDANRLPEGATIYPSTTLLIPLRAVPAAVSETASPAPPPAPPPPREKGGSNTGLRIGIGVGIPAFAFAAAIAILCIFIRRRARKPPAYESAPSPTKDRAKLPADLVAGLSQMGHELPYYELEELKAATGDFSPACRIKGSVYRGVTKAGTAVAIKQIKGHVSPEIHILKTLNHSNLIRLVGYCAGEGHSYLVYEYAEHGCLSECLGGSCGVVLGWRQRVQIALDVADGLRYLHNYANPPYVHKDVKSSNILLDGDYRAKLSNFAMAKSGEGFRVTKHVEGTKGYLAPEYLAHGLVTPKLDVFSLGVVLLEILSARGPVDDRQTMLSAAIGPVDDRQTMLSAAIGPLVGAENPEEMMRSFVDPALGDAYPLDMALAMARLANACVQHDLAVRPTADELVLSLSEMLSASLRWESDRTPQDAGR